MVRHGRALTWIAAAVVFLLAVAWMGHAPSRSLNQGGERRILLEDANGGGMGETLVASRLARIAAAARATDSLAWPIPQHSATTAAHKATETEGDSLAALSREAAEAQKEEKAAELMAHTARTAASDGDLLRENAVESDAITKAISAARASRHRADEAVAAEDEEEPKASEAQQRKALSKQVESLKFKKEHYKREAALDKAEAARYVAEARKAILGESLADETSEIMADAPFDRSAETVYSMLKKLQDDKRELDGKAKGAEAETRSLVAKALSAQSVEDVSDDALKTAKAEEVHSKLEAKAERSSAKLAKTSAGKMALEHSAMQQALASVKAARGRFEAAEGTLALAREERAEEERKAAAKAAKAQAADKARARAAALKAREMAAHAAALRAKAASVGKARQGAALVGAEEKRARAKRGLTWPQKMQWPHPAAASRGAGMSVQREEGVFRSAYGDAFKDAFKAVFGAQGSEEPRRVSAEEAASKDTSVRVRQQQQQKEALQLAAPTQALVESPGVAMEGGGEGKGRLQSLERGAADLGSQFTDQDVPYGSRAAGRHRGAPREWARVGHGRGRGELTRREEVAVQREVEEVLDARDRRREQRASSFKQREHGSLWSYSNPRVVEPAAVSRPEGGGGGGYVLVPEKEWDVVRGRGEIQRVHVVGGVEGVEGAAVPVAVRAPAAERQMARGVAEAESRGGPVRRGALGDFAI